MLDTHRQWLLLKICALLCLLFSIYAAARRGMAAWYFRKGSPEAIQTAIKWDPANPEYYEALGNLTHLYADSGNSSDIVHLYQTATDLSPHDAHCWADLGGAYDWAGRENDALIAFQRALRLFPNSPEINWRLANFCIRTGRTPEGLRALRTTLKSDSARRQVFVLAANVTPNNRAILEILPVQAPIFFDYLNFRIEQRDIAGAEEVWDRIVQLNFSFDVREAFPYLDALIQHKELRQLAEGWSVLASRFPAQIERPASSNLVTNGSFEFDLLNGGLDWRVISVEGAAVTLDSTDAPAGTRALRITFDGTRNLDYGHVFQYVAAQPNSTYRFSGYMRVQGITTDTGPRFQVCDAYHPGDLFVSTDNLIGTSGWVEQHAEFTTNTDTGLLLIRVSRPLSGKFDNQIAGSVWIDRVSLRAEP
jgi:tetratricopeptide (TPR) repeat protein